MKMRVWAGRPTLATEQGKSLDNFEQFERWLAKQPAGQIEVWAGRWWAVSREAIPFTVKDGKAFCDHPGYRGKSGLDPHDFPGFFAYEAWEKARKLASLWGDIPKMAGDITKATDEDASE